MARRIWIFCAAFSFMHFGHAQRADAGPPANDDCANAAMLFSGNPSTNFSTIGATTDGPPHPRCLNFGDDQVNQDIWFHYISPRTDFQPISTCGSDFDTKIAVYEGCSCPVSDLNLLVCNDDSCGFQTLVVPSLIEDACYTIRVGGYKGNVGTGLLQFAMSTGDPCLEAKHSCCSTGGPGCTDPECCQAVCMQDPFCCDVQWDVVCLGQVGSLCGSICAEPCGPGNPHDCFTIGIYGCNDVTCCEAVCCVHPFCCEEEWDAQCVALAELLCQRPCEVVCPPNAMQESENCGDSVNDGCEMQYGCDGPFPDCCNGHAGIGCSDPACTASVCAADPFCCETQWDEICAAAACNDSNCQCDPVAGTPFEFIDCGDIICGTLWSAGSQRDSDWYEFSTTGHGYIEWNVASEYPVNITISNGSCPTNDIAISTGKCLTVSSPLLEPGAYFVTVAPIPFGCVGCSGNNHYVATLSCNIPCPADVTGNNAVNVDDLLMVINDWGQCFVCWSDVDNNGLVNVDDLLTVINGWGACE
jgi:hypothetical protein